MDYGQQLAQVLDKLRRDFAQYRVEMALRLDTIERRVDSAENALACAGYRPLRPAHAPAAPSYGHGPAVPGFSALPHHSQAPLPIDPRSYDQSPGYQPAPSGYTHQPPRGAVRPSRQPGSRENAQYLPFAMEKIAQVSQTKSRGDRRTCVCGRPNFDLKCFREHHFDWCLFHQRPIVQGQRTCGGKNVDDCQAITWEKHDDWETIVRTSFDSTHLGQKKVEDLFKVLFPIEVYPEKYEGSWYVG